MSPTKRIGNGKARFKDKFVTQKFAPESRSRNTQKKTVMPYGVISLILLLIQASNSQSERWDTNIQSPGIITADYATGTTDQILGGYTTLSLVNLKERKVTSIQTPSEAQPSYFYDIKANYPNNFYLILQGKTEIDSAAQTPVDTIEVIYTEIQDTQAKHWLREKISFLAQNVKKAAVFSQKLEESPDRVLLKQRIMIIADFFYSFELDNQKKTSAKHIKVDSSPTSRLEAGFLIERLGMIVVVNRVDNTILAFTEEFNKLELRQRGKITPIRSPVDLAQHPSHNVSPSHYYFGAYIDDQSAHIIQYEKNAYVLGVVASLDLVSSGALSQETKFTTDSTLSGLKNSMFLMALNKNPRSQGIFVLEHQPDHQNGDKIVLLRTIQKSMQVAGGGADGAFLMRGMRVWATSDQISFDLSKNLQNPQTSPNLVFTKQFFNIGCQAEEAFSPGPSQPGAQPTSTGACKKISLINEGCSKMEGITTKCLDCSKGYFLAKGRCSSCSGAIKNCVECYTPVSASPQLVTERAPNPKCSRCSPPYLPDSSKDFCTRCPSDSYLEKQKCISCENLIPFCEICQKLPEKVNQEENVTIKDIRCSACSFDSEMDRENDKCHLVNPDGGAIEIEHQKLYQGKREIKIQFNHQVQITAEKDFLLALKLKNGVSGGAEADLQAKITKLELSEDSRIATLSFEFPDTTPLEINSFELSTASDKAICKKDDKEICFHAFSVKFDGFDFYSMNGVEGSVERFSEGFNIVFNSVIALSLISSVSGAYSLLTIQQMLWSAYVMDLRLPGVSDKFLQAISQDFIYYSEKLFDDLFKKTGLEDRLSGWFGHYRAPRECKLEFTGIEQYDVGCSALKENRGFFMIILALFVIKLLLKTCASLVPSRKSIQKVDKTPSNSFPAPQVTHSRKRSCCSIGSLFLRMNSFFDLYYVSMLVNSLQIKAFFINVSILRTRGFKGVGLVGKIDYFVSIIFSVVIAIWNFWLFSIAWKKVYVPSADLIEKTKKKANQVAQEGSTTSKKGLNRSSGANQLTSKMFQKIKKNRTTRRIELINLKRLVILNQISTNIALPSLMIYLINLPLILIFFLSFTLISSAWNSITRKPMRRTIDNAILILTDILKLLIFGSFASFEVANQRSLGPKSLYMIFGPAILVLCVLLIGLNILHLLIFEVLCADRKKVIAAPQNEELGPKAGEKSTKESKNNNSTFNDSIDAQLNQEQLDQSLNHLPIIKSRGKPMKKLPKKSGKDKFKKKKGGKKGGQEILGGKRGKRSKAEKKDEKRGKEKKRLTLNPQVGEENEGPKDKEVLGAYESYLRKFRAIGHVDFGKKVGPEVVEAPVNQMLQDDFE